MAVALVQAVEFDADGADPTVAVTLTVTAGSTLALAVGNYQNGIVTGIADTQSNTWVFADTLTSGAMVCETWYVAVAAAGSTTITVTFNAACTFRNVHVHEISGTSATPLDKISQATGNSAGSVTPSTDGQYVFGHSFNDVAANMGAGGGFTEQTNGVSYIGSNSVNAIQTTATPVNVTVTGGSGTQITSAVTFKAAAAGGPSVLLQSQICL